MMRREISPLRLACVSLVGSLVIPGVLLLSLWHVLPGVVSGHWSSLTHQQREIRLLVLLVPLLCGGALWLVPLFRLMRGVKRNRWTEEELTGVRRWMEHPAWLGVVLLCFLGATVVFLRYPTASVILLIVPAQAVLQLKTILKKKPVEYRSVLGL